MVRPRPRPAVAPRRPSEASAAVVVRALDGEVGGAFVWRRALVEPWSPRERACLERLMAERAAGRARGAARAALALAVQWERRGWWAAAAAVLERALGWAPTADMALHAGRLARLAGERERARAWYAAVPHLPGGAKLARLAAVGGAMVAAQPEAALTRVAADAWRAGDWEAAAVAFEERGRLRRARGAVSAAARDWARAVRLYPDADDRGRVLFALADLAAAGRPRAARELLLAAAALGDPTQRAEAEARLAQWARRHGDEVGRRRWRASRGMLVAVGLPRQTRDDARWAELAGRWRVRLVGARANGR